MPPLGTDVLVLPPVELPRGVDVPGTVVDETGHGVAGATVEATWQHGTGRAQLVMSRTDAEGRFVLHGVDPMAELTYRAWLVDSCTSRGTTAQAAAALSKPVVLTISPSASSTLSGRVLDIAERPISGASVRIWRVGRGKDRRVIDLEPIMSEDGRAAVRTDSDGRYRAPRRVPIPDEYFAEVVAPGRLSARSRSVIVADQAKELPAVTLRRVRAVSGQVVDRQGKPVAGAKVGQAGDGPMPTATTSDEQGRFELPGVLEGRLVLLVRKAGYRSEPHLMERSAEPLKVAITRVDEPPASTYKTLPSPLPVEEEKALARRLVRPLVERVLAEGKDQDRSRLLRDLAEIDPAWTLELLEKTAFNDSEDRAYVAQSCGCRPGS